MRIALIIEYDGSQFYGWQTQQNLPTIQECLTNAISQIAAEPVEIFCAGRTDAGVHATYQVIHFVTHSERTMQAWTLGVNTHLPPQIAVRDALIVDDDFHARFSALSRTYRYWIDTAKLRPALLHKKVTWHFYSLDENLMQEGANHLLGENDFTSFRSSQCESKTPMRNVHAISVHRIQELVCVEITANAFLHHMVRNIIGVLLPIGEGIKLPSWTKEVLLAKDRTKAAATAPAAGLYLTKVEYPKAYAFPDGNSRIAYFI